jgi:TolB-like protein
MTSNSNKIIQFWQEFRRRKVLPFLIGYVAACFAIIEFFLNTSERYLIPESTLDLIYILAAIGLPIVIILPWFINRSNPVITAKESSVRKSQDLIDSTTLEKSIAVLPFDNLSDDATQFWFTEGISDVIINQLVKISELRVLSRTSTLKFKEEKKTIPDIGNELGVNYILEGSVQKHVDQIRITTQLIRVRNESHIWSEIYDNEWKEIFHIQTEIAKQVADKTKAMLSPQEEYQIQGFGTENTDAYTLFLKGNHLLYQLTEESIHKAIDYYKQAIDIDPLFAEAYSGMAMAYTELTSWDVANTDPKLIPEVIGWANRAMEINDRLGEPHYSLGAMKYIHHWDWAGAEQSFIKGTELNPSYVWGRLWFANFLTFMGRFQDSIELGRQTLKLDPLNNNSYMELAASVWFNGQEEEAFDLMNRSLELNPEFLPTKSGLAQMYASKGESNQFVSEYCEETMNSLQFLPDLLIGQLGQILVPIGRHDEAVELLTELKQRAERRVGSPYLNMGIIYNALGEDENAIECFEKSYDQREPFMFMINIRLIGESIYSNPRMLDLLTKMELQGKV